MIALLLVAAQIEVHVEIAGRHFSDDGGGISATRIERRYFANGILRLESRDGILLFDTTKKQITIGSNTTKTYARLTLEAYDAMQFDIDIPDANLKLLKLTPSDHDNRCELTGPMRGVPVRIRVQTLPSSDDAKAMQAALDRARLTAGSDFFYYLAWKYRELAPEASACFDSPNLVNERESVAGDAFYNKTRSMKMTRMLEHDSLPAELFRIPQEWTESAGEAKKMLEALLDSNRP